VGCQSSRTRWRGCSPAATPAYYEHLYRETTELREASVRLKQGIPRIHVFEAAANFVLCSFPATGPCAATVCEHCRKQSVYLRDVGKMGERWAAMRCGSRSKTRTLTAGRRHPRASSRRGPRPLIVPLDSQGDIHRVGGVAGSRSPGSTTVLGARSSHRTETTAQRIDEGLASRPGFPVQGSNVYSLGTGALLLSYGNLPAEIRKR